MVAAFDVGVVEKATLVDRNGCGGYACGTAVVVIMVTLTMWRQLNRPLWLIDMIMESMHVALHPHRKTMLVPDLWIGLEATMKETVVDTIVAIPYTSHGGGLSGH